DSLGYKNDTTMGFWDLLSFAVRTAIESNVMLYCVRWDSRTHISGSGKTIGMDGTLFISRVTFDCFRYKFRSCTGFLVRNS
ncbi:hypothetical protein, partial [Cyclobacterium qasimii]|uniref:hypothetical protein n=1 Tax=Cyclobacterium qasimii TaxID=1350429 RepID=UPI001C3FE6B9